MLQNFKKPKKFITVLAIAVGIVLWLGIRITPASPIKRDINPNRTLSYIEDGILYQLTTNARATRTPILAQNAWFGILDVQQDLNKTLFVANPKDYTRSKGEFGVYGKGELWLLDETRMARKIYSEEPIDASLSPDGTQIAFVSDIGKVVKILDINGALIRTIPGRSWGTIVWSHDGKSVAYTKLSKPPCKEGADIIDSDLCKAGIAVFDLENGVETLLTQNGSDDGPISFSRDNSKLYINSGRSYEEWPTAHVLSLWVVDVATKQAKRLTNHFTDFKTQTNYVPTINKADTLWSSDGSVAFSSRALDEGTWMFSFSSSGEVVKAKRIADGDSPRWLVREKTVVTRVIREGKSMWQPVVME